MPSKLVRRAVAATAFVLSALAAGPLAAQVSLTVLGAPATQNFSGLASSGTPTWTDNSTIGGWYAQFGTTTNPTAYTPGTGSSATGALYSFGVAATNPITDRALGSVGSGTTTDIYWAA